LPREVTKRSHQEQGEPKHVPDVENDCVFFSRLIHPLRVVPFEQKMPRVSGGWTHTFLMYMMDIEEARSVLSVINECQPAQDLDARSRSHVPCFPH
jgi:hypothetical protein